VIVRFPQQKPDRWASLLIDGTCDVILPDPILATSWQQWTELGALGEAVVWADIATTVLRLDLNLDPESRTGSSEGAIAATPLQEAQIREALDLCIDRERLTQLMPAEALIPAGGFVPPNHPAHGGASPVYDPDQAKDLLDGAGWRDGDRDKFREAVDAPGFEPGTPLEFTIQFAPQYFVIAAHIAADLETCGIKANLEPTTVNQLYTAGATSPLFGRRFESVLLGWHAEVPQVCGGWLSDRIPDEDNDWTGENFSGYVSEAYDAACKQALTAVELEQEVSALGRAQQLLQQDRPTLFLAWRPFWFAARPEVQGLKPDASAYSTIWNIEEIHIASSDIEE
jgi:peptide/nickel transport system substrate-binding protein